jgi:predicted RNase H-like HicB family nuclease
MMRPEVSRHCGSSPVGSGRRYPHEWARSGTISYVYNTGVDGPKGGRTTIAVITDHVEKGWIASAPELCVLAQGATRDEAVESLLSFIRTYPGALDELRRDGQSTERDVTLVAVYDAQPSRAQRPGAHRPQLLVQR